MKQITLPLIAAMAAWLTNASAALLVTEVTGKADVDGKAPLVTMATVPDGSTLSLQANATVVAVDLATGKEYLLKGGQDYRVTPQGPQGSRSKVAATALPAKGMPDIRIAPGMVAQATLVMRSLPKVGAPSPVSPVKTVVISDQPAFRWSPVEAATGYRISIQKPDGSLHWETRTQDVQLTLPATHRLAPGEKYVWRIECQLEGGRTTEASAEFSVAPSAVITQLAALKADAGSPFSRRVLYAALLTEVGAKEEARTLWRELSKERPDDSVLRKFAEAR